MRKKFVSIVGQVVGVKRKRKAFQFNQPFDLGLRLLELFPEVFLNNDTSKSSSANDILRESGWITEHVVPVLFAQKT